MLNNRRKVGDTKKKEERRDRKGEGETTLKDSTKLNHS